MDDSIEYHDKIRKIITKCRRCPSLFLNHVAPVMGDSHLGASVLVVGQNPGECYDGKFQDWSYEQILWNCLLGKFLRELVEGIIPWYDLYFTNLANCMSSGNRVITDEEFSNCRYIFNLRISVLKNIKMAIVFGKRAEKFREWVSPELSENTIFCYHPSYLDRRVSRSFRNAKMIEYRNIIKERYESLR